VVQYELYRVPPAGIKSILLIRRPNGGTLNGFCRRLSKQAVAAKGFCRPRHEASARHPHPEPLLAHLSPTGFQRVLHTHDTTNRTTTKRKHGRATYSGAFTIHPTRIIDPHAAASSIRRLKLERGAVHAVAQPGRRGPVVKHVPQVPLALVAAHLGARHEEDRVVRTLVHRALDGLVEAGPAGAGLVLGVGREEGAAAAGTDKGALALLLVEGAGEGALGAGLSGGLRRVEEG